MCLSIECNPAWRYQTVPIIYWSRNFFINLGFFRCCGGDSTNAQWTLYHQSAIIDWHSAICYSTWVTRVIPNHNSFMTKNDFVKASRDEFSKTRQINYSTVLPRFATNGPRLRWVHFMTFQRKTACKIYFPLYHICFFLLVY